MTKQLQQLLAEVFGTFVLVFVGATAVVAWGGGGSGGGAVAPYGFGIGLLAALYMFAETSGGHFNPIVSLSMFLDRRMGARDVVGYWIAQFVGAVLACLALLLMSSSHDVGTAATVPGSHGVRGAFFAELFCSALFMLVILAVTRSQASKSTVYVAIGLTLLAIHFAIVPFSGSSVNPARSFGTALIGNRWTDFWIYIIAPPLGAILGWLLYTVIVKGSTNLRDDFDAMRSEIAGARGGGSTAEGGPPSGSDDSSS
ncbi:MAG: MIP/aquaporin family protein [Verrucomicrobiota bacterium]